MTADERGPGVASQARQKVSPAALASPRLVENRTASTVGDRRSTRLRELRDLPRGLRESALRGAHGEARAAGDREAARLLAEWADDDFVARAYRRAVDVEVIRLRRLLRVGS
jgi:hypothetical protein